MVSKASRSSNMGLIGLSTALCLKDYFERAGNNPEIIDNAVSRIHRKENERGPIAVMHALSLSFYDRSLASLSEESIAPFFPNSTKEAISRFTFSHSPSRVMSSLIQSTTNTPAILTSWYFDVTNLSTSENYTPWKRHLDIPLEKAIPFLNSPQLAVLLKQAGKTSSGYYRNSPGKISYESFVRRSVDQPLANFKDWLKINSLASDTMPITPTDHISAHFSAEYLQFMYERLKTHNTSLNYADLPNSHESGHDAKSHGCPVSKPKLYISNEMDLPDPSFGYTLEGNTASLTFNPYTIIHDAVRHGYSRVIERLA